MWNKIQRIYVGSTQVRPPKIKSAWIYHNPSEWLLSISSDGTNWITITDKNLWATQVYNVWDTLSDANCGYMYQRWNNYWFSSIGTISTNTNTAVNTSSYSWQNPYSWSPFIVWTSGSPNDWSSNDNPDLWWDTTNTKIARKWPCPEWFHVATQSEWQALVTTMTGLGITTSQWNKYQQYLKIPFSWYRKYNAWWSVTNQWTWACLWSTTTLINESNTRQAWDLWITSSVADYTDYSARAWWLSIRPMKNEPIIPNMTWTVIYQPS